MVINIRCVNMDLTSALRTYVEEKMESLSKFQSRIMVADVDIGRDTLHHHKGEVFKCAVVLDMGGEVLKIEREAEDLYKAIDKVKDHFRELLVSDKERQRDEKRKPN